MLELKIKRLSETATLPKKAHPTDACFDIYADALSFRSDGEITIAPHETVKLPTGFATNIPHGYWGAVLILYSILYYTQLCMLASLCCFNRRVSERRGRLFEGPLRCRFVSCVSCPPSVSRGACVCGIRRHRSTWRLHLCGRL